MSDFRFEVWPTEFRKINQYFGANPQNYAQFGLPGHEGIDILAPTGTKIFCVAPGRVSRVERNPNLDPYGIHVRVEHRDGYKTIYAHMQQALVENGQEVGAGHVLGLADDTGNSFGSHLHITLKKDGANAPGYRNNIIDPTPFLLPLMGWQTPAGPYVDGWAYLPGITVAGSLAQANVGGINLRETPSVNGRRLGLAPGGTILIVSGAARGQYVPVRAPLAAVGMAEPAPPPAPTPAPPPPPTVSTVEGWAFAPYLTISDSQAVVGQYGINLRQAPDRNSTNIGLVKGGSTVSVTGGATGEYLPVRVRREDFGGAINLPAAPPVAPAGTVSAAPAGSYFGWAWSQYLTVAGSQATVGRFGINLRSRASQSGQNIGLVKGFATVTIAGKARGDYTPILARQEDVLNPAQPTPPIEPAEALAPEAPAPPAPPVPPQDSTPGWAFTSQIVVEGETAMAGQYGINLRSAPRRDAQNIGFVPAYARMVILGGPQGEYTPVRVDDEVLQPAFGTAPAVSTTVVGPVLNPDPAPLGGARLGLHAAADPDISDREHLEFAAARPGMIKVLSFHSPEAIRRLAQAHTEASWVVRAFLDFGGRNITPDQFLNDTLSDVKRSLDELQGKDVVVELHNEPNLVPEGLGASWADGGAFAAWFSELLAKYRQALPGVRFLYPGLSPGNAVNNLKHDHIQFVEASRRAVEAADGLGVHIYWSNVYPMTTALSVLDDYISRFRFKPIWVTEASNNKAGTTAAQKGTQYLRFWQELQKRATVQGVTFFVASASNPAFAEEVWVGRGIGEAVGRR
jgi:hypothetical protein